MYIYIITRLCYEVWTSGFKTQVEESFRAVLKKN